MALLGAQIVTLLYDPSPVIQVGKLSPEVEPLATILSIDISVLQALAVTVKKAVASDTGDAATCV
jgi:hypothetical protein